MNRFTITAITLAALGFAGLTVPVANADIYSWTDENGVRHFTNHAPPKHAKLLIKSPEISHDEEAHQRRLEEDRLAVARQELAEREAFLLQQQLEAERRIAAANARAEAALREADQLLQDAEASADSIRDDRWSGYGYSIPYYSIGSPNLYRGYKRYDGSLFRVRHPLKHRRHPYHYGKRNPYRRQPDKYGYHNKHHRYPTPSGSIDKHRSKGVYQHRSYHHRGVRNHPSLTRGRYPTHRARAATFRGRHGRF